MNKVVQTLLSINSFSKQLGWILMIDRAPVHHHAKFELDLAVARRLRIRESLPSMIRPRPRRRVPLRESIRLCELQFGWLEVNHVEQDIQICTVAPRPSIENDSLLTCMG